MGSTEQIERVFDVDRTFVAPAFTRVDGAGRGVHPVSGVEERRLDAVYYDTDDLRLARNHSTLRRRRGDGDQGWYLTLPAANDEIEEISRPLGDPDVIPGDLLDLVAVRTRGNALRPVARLSTVRRAQRLGDESGRALIELADDLVKAQSMGERTVVSTWREIGIEAVDSAGDELLPAAAEALRGAGARPSRSPSKLLRALATDLGPADTTLTKGGTGKGGTGKGGGSKAGGSKAGGSKAGGSKAGGSKAGRRAAGADGGAAAAPTAGRVIHGYLAEQTGELLAMDPRVRLDAPEAVHDLRVAARRLRSAVQTFRPLFDAERAAGIQAGLKELGEVLAVPRDAEVQLARHLSAVDGQSAEDVLGPVRARVEQTLLGERLRGAESALAYLRGETYLAFVEELLGFVADVDQTQVACRPASQVLPRLVRKADRRLTRRVDRARRAPAGPGRDTGFHDARKAAKRLRYACEAVVPAFGADATRLGTQAKRVQTLLGEHQDCVVARQRLRDLGIAANLVGEPSFTYGLLAGAERARAARTVDEFTRRWPKLARKRYRRWLHA